MEPYDALRKQIVADIEELTTLEGMVACGETEVQIRLDRLESAIQIKVAILHGLEAESNNSFQGPPDDDRNFPM